jgi:hypothetical protein
MTRQMFALWLEEMKLLGIIETDAQASRLLGVHYNTMTNWRQRGTPNRAHDLACAAVLYGIVPYGEIQPTESQEAAE